MTKRRSQVLTTKESAPAGERFARGGQSPILLTERELEAVAAAGAKPGVSGGPGEK